MRRQGPNLNRAVAKIHRLPCGRKWSCWRSPRIGCEDRICPLRPRPAFGLPGRGSRLGLRHSFTLLRRVPRALILISPAFDRRRRSRDRPKTEVPGYEKKGQGERADLYARITDRIVADLEKAEIVMDRALVGRKHDRTDHPAAAPQRRSLWRSQRAAVVVGEHSEGLCLADMDDVQTGLAAGWSCSQGETGTTVIYASRFTKSETDSNGGEVERDIPFINRTRCSTWRRSTACLPDHYHGVPEPLLSRSSASVTPTSSSAMAQSFGTAATRHTILRPWTISRCTTVRSLHRCRRVCGSPQP